MLLKVAVNRKLRKIVIHIMHYILHTQLNTSISIVLRCRATIILPTLLISYQHEAPVYRNSAVYMACAITSVRQLTLSSYCYSHQD